MIVPEKFTNFELDDKGLEEYALFCLMVFNKNANQTAVKLESFLEWTHRLPTDNFRELDHFAAIRRRLKRYRARDLVEKFKFGNTTVKSDGLLALVNSGLDLRTCSTDDLEAIPGYGMKTSRYFILHTRQDAEVACLDTHVLEWLSYYTGHEVKKGLSKNKYLELEQVFLEIAKAMKTSPADLDLKIWNKQRGSDEKPLARSTQKKTGNVLDS